MGLTQTNRDSVTGRPRVPGSVLRLELLFFNGLPVSSIAAGPICGMRPVPSDRPANRYGPNPDEVTP